MRFRRFWRNEDGNAALLFALALFPMMALGGGGMDYLRTSALKQALQAAVDRAALNAAGKPTATAAELLQIGKDYIIGDASLAPLNLQQIPAPVVDAVAGTVSYTASGSFTTMFGKFSGLGSVTMSATGTAQRVQGSTQIVLVLDASSSMTTSFGGKTRLQALKDAAISLTSTVMNSSGTGAAVGIVPYALMVQLKTSELLDPSGAGSRDPASWIDMPQGTTTTCTYGPASACYQPCTVDGTQTTCLTPSAPGCNVQSCQQVGWSGCVSYRDTSWRDRIDLPSTYKYRGIVAICPPLAANLTTSISQVQSRINGLTTVAQGTWIPIGLAWGWNMLTPDPPYVAPDRASVEAKGAKRVLILISDGENTATPNNYNYTRADGSIAVGNGNGLHWVWPTNRTGSTDPDALTKTLCDKIGKDDAGNGLDIDLYTVLVDVTNQSFIKLMQDCATTPDMSFTTANPAGLNSALAQIATQVQSVKLVR